MSFGALPIDFLEGINPCESLIKTQKVFFHQLGQFYNIAYKNTSENEILTTISFASLTVANYQILYTSFLDYMPDKNSKTLLEKLLNNMEKLTNPVLGKSTEETDHLKQKREEYHNLFDEILLNYASLTEYLKKEK